MAADPERVGLLALVYDELGKGCSTGPRRGELSLVEDLESEPGSVSLLTMLTADALHPVDWEIVTAIFEHPVRLHTLYAGLANDPYRAEALLHAWPGDTPTPYKVPLAFLAPERWQAVEEAIALWRSTGIAASGDEVEAVASRAYQAAGLGNAEDYLLWRHE